MQAADDFRVKSNAAHDQKSGPFTGLSDVKFSKLPRRNNSSSGFTIERNPQILRQQVLGAQWKRTGWHAGESIGDISQRTVTARRDDSS
jgi:hypothetical protein